MSREFRMPSLGADMEAGILREWRVQPGSSVRKGDVVALVETDKGIIDIESYVEGTVETLVAATDARVPVGAVLALLSGDPETPVPTTPAPPVGDSPQRQRVSPAARARAVALGVDLATLTGSGPEGAVTLQDVEQAAAHAAPPVSPGGGMRHAIAAAMSRAKREIPHYYLQLAMDLSPTLQWLDAHNAVAPVPERLLLAVLQLKAVAQAAAALSGFSGTYEQEQFLPAPVVNAGMAIALRGGGLVAPAIADTASKPLPVLMQALQDLVARVRHGHLRSSELSSATLTVTSLGEEGVEALWPIIHPPQVAIVGFGSPVLRPWVVGDQVVPRTVLTLSLAADHRVTDGRLGAQFLARVRDALSKPEAL